MTVVISFSTVQNLTKSANCVTFSLQCFSEQIALATNYASGAEIRKRRRVEVLPKMQGQVPGGTQAVVQPQASQQGGPQTVVIQQQQPPQTVVQVVQQQQQQVVQNNAKIDQAQQLSSVGEFFFFISALLDIEMFAFVVPRHRGTVSLYTV